MCSLMNTIPRQCKSVIQEQSQSTDEQIIPNKYQTSVRQKPPEKPHKWEI